MISGTTNKALPHATNALRIAIWSSTLMPTPTALKLKATPATAETEESGGAWFLAARAPAALVVVAARGGVRVAPLPGRAAEPQPADSRAEARGKGRVELGGEDPPRAFARSAASARVRATATC